MDWTVLLLYFIIGCIHDIGTTFWYLMVESRKVFKSGFVSFLLTILGYGVLGYMILSPNFIPRLVVYALGTWVGTSLVVYFNSKGKK